MFSTKDKYTIKSRLGDQKYFIFILEKNKKRVFSRRGPPTLIFFYVGKDNRNQNNIDLSNVSKLTKLTLAPLSK